MTLADVIGGWEAAGATLANGIATWPMGTSVAGGMNACMLAGPWLADMFHVFNSFFWPDVSMVGCRNGF